MHILKTYQFLSMKPMLIALNFDESQRAGYEAALGQISGSKGNKDTRVVSFFGKIEMEMSELPDEEARVFMEEYGIKESALNTLISQAYALLGLQSFFTVGEDECRAWTIRKGMTAQEASGAIHTDFVNKFIRAEVVHYEDFISHGGSFAKVKEAGLWKLAIHTDFVNKFIRAEVVHYVDFISHGGSFAKVKEAGLWKLAIHTDFVNKFIRAEVVH